MLAYDANAALIRMHKRHRSVVVAASCVASSPFHEGVKHVMHRLMALKRGACTSCKGDLRPLNAQLIEIKLSIINESCIKYDDKQPTAAATRSPQISLV